MVIVQCELLATALCLVAAPANLLYRSLNPAASDLNGDVGKSGRQVYPPQPLLPAVAKSGGKPVSNAGGILQRKKTWLELINPTIGGLNNQQDGGINSKLIASIDPILFLSLFT